MPRPALGNFIRLLVTARRFLVGGEKCRIKQWAGIDCVQIENGRPCWEVGGPVDQAAPGKDSVWCNDLDNTRSDIYFLHPSTTFPWSPFYHTISRSPPTNQTMPKMGSFPPSHSLDRFALDSCLPLMTAWTQVKEMKTAQSQEDQVWHLACTHTY